MNAVLGRIEKIINRGIPSNNNLNIAGNILQDSVNFSKKDIIIVMWSCPSRFSVMFGELRESESSYYFK